MRKAIFWSFNILLIVVPVIFYPWNSEVFEFNKIIATYLITIIIVALWLARMVIEKKIIFRRTILDIPLIVFLASQFLSAIFSLDTRTSWLGYYSRFNGGLTSLLSCTLLYWAYVSNIKVGETKTIVKTALITLTAVSVWAACEHFGHSPSCLFVTGKFDADCWVQDVVTRVFATLGQPNWLAAYIVALIPSVGVKIVNSQKDKFDLKKATPWLAVFGLLTAVLLFTKSRSGILGFAIALGIFLVLVSFTQIKNTKRKINHLTLPAVIALIIVVVGLIFGTPWTPSLKEITGPKKVSSKTTATSPGLVLETGGTESGEIRKIVWQGALDVWKHHPIFGSGVETFAFAYWQQRPMAHNLTSEWDFIYNKAHNEYLNFLATTGSLGFLAYVTLIGFATFQMIRKGSQEKDLSEKIFVWGLISGYLGILVTNFFGFSVVITSLLFFLLPAMAIADTDEERVVKITPLAKIALIIITIMAGCLVTLTTRYWYADYLYAKARIQEQRSDYNQAMNLLIKAVKISPKEAVYRNELAQTYAAVAVLLSQNQKQENLETFQATLEKIQTMATDQSHVAQVLSPHNPNILRGAANVYTDLSLIQVKYILESITILERLTSLAPTDPSAYYRLGLAYYRAGHKTDAIKSLQKAIDLKPNYKTVRQKLATIYQLENQPDLAKAELLYILEKIDPVDQTAQNLLKEISGQN